MIAGYTILVIAVIADTCQFQYISAWMPTTGTGSRSRGIPIPTSYVSLESRTFANLNADKPKTTTANNKGDADDTISQDGVDNKPTVEWGVSYIGGDPCGSKLNSDPFDKNPSDKPGLPDDMKARIEVLAQKKLQEEREKNSQ
jgi:hypothetical protein